MDDGSGGGGAKSGSIFLGAGTIEGCRLMIGAGRFDKNVAGFLPTGWTGSEAVAESSSAPVPSPSREAKKAVSTFTGLLGTAEELDLCCCPRNVFLCLDRVGGNLKFESLCGAANAPISDGASVLIIAADIAGGRSIVNDDDGSSNETKDSKGINRSVRSIVFYY